MRTYKAYHGVTKPFPPKVYFALMHDRFPSNRHFEEDFSSQADINQTSNQQELYLARKDEVPRYMKPVIELIKRILIGLHTDKKDFEVLSDIQRTTVCTYMRYILKEECIKKIFSLEAPLEEYTFADSDFLDLSKRKDETLKKVMSVALKVIYKDYLFKHKINQSLNPRKYVKRKDINRKIFELYFKRSPEIVYRGKVETEEHYLLFFIKEGVTEEWFESIIGIRAKDREKLVPNLHFLKEILTTLASNTLLEVYRRKITSMAKKIFVMDRKFSVEGFDRNAPETAHAWYKHIQNRLDLRNKKPKTALSILQFSQAIDVALQSLRRFSEKYELIDKYKLDPKLFERPKLIIEPYKPSTDLNGDHDGQSGDSDNSSD